MNGFEFELDNGDGVVIHLLAYIHQQKKDEKKEDYSENESRLVHLFSSKLILRIVIREFELPIEY
jgi:hypothetical protein